MTVANAIIHDLHIQMHEIAYKIIFLLYFLFFSSNNKHDEEHSCSCRRVFNFPYKSFNDKKKC